VSCPDIQAITVLTGTQLSDLVAQAVILRTLHGYRSGSQFVIPGIGAIMSLDISCSAWDRGYQTPGRKVSSPGK
jgi:hypothetical protein